jgi:hypothetical protein
MDLEVPAQLMHVVFYSHRNTPNGEFETVETGKVTLTPDGLVAEGDGADWMDRYPKGLIEGDDDESYLRSLAACAARFTYSGAGVVED